MNERKIVAINRTILDGLHKGITSWVVLRSKHKARRIHVKAMDDTETVILALNICQVIDAAMVNKGIH